ncbi:unnamed protein product [Urochloa decumbens]|uniref:F-box domain-containing protein n=1 Tax=Urochloa decumbens TaxID=240449 RepID=A0ABC8W0S6_9POAL
MGDGWDSIPADVFLDILLRIPPSPRRRLRLVCRHWRDIIDERAHEPVATGPREGCSRELDLQGCGVDSVDGVVDVARVSLIGTCNGLLCLRRKRGDIAVANPVIGETVVVDPPPTSLCRDKSSYSFGYHPATGQYKVVHVPCNEWGSDLVAVHVFTLGDAAWQWRAVPAPAGSSCLLRFGLATVDGVTYWATKDGERIMSFDLKDERFEAVEAPPLLGQQPPLGSCHLFFEEQGSCHLTDVGRKLGLVVVSDAPDEFKTSKTEVWVLEDGTWVERYTVLADGWYRPPQKIALPHFAHGEHVLTIYKPFTWTCASCELTLEAHRPRQERKMRTCGMVRVGAPRPETTVGVYDIWSDLRTFAYVETREPLLVYGEKPRRINDNWDEEFGFEDSFLLRLEEV